ncbi:MAG TPA: helix-turn-helix domain-containing protein [Trebonia sp.]|jgi:excisionase family DNA binding protein|nr:helix-turn-helix domain-containing protein [Trebonia sp.]
MDDPKLLTVAEIAALLRLSKMTVYRLIHQGDLPAKRIGRTFRVAEAAVLEYLGKAST